MTTSRVRTREATTDDVGAVAALYERCSAAALEQRFHVPVAAVPERIVRHLVTPPDGWSLLAEQGGEVVGHGCAAPTWAATVEVGLLVDDAFQGTGVGTRLLRDLVTGARERGFAAMSLSVVPDNEAVLATVRRAGLDAFTRHVDGVLEVDVALGPTAVELRQPA
jgi:GNAT superfamily N-acetyltransferase